MRFHVKLRGRVSYLLIALIIIHFSYPFSELSNWASALYVTLYCIMTGIGIYITSINEQRLRWGSVMTAVTILFGIAWALTSNDRELNWVLFVFYVVIIFDLILIAFTIWEFIFSAESVTREVLFAGVTLYMLIGNIFTPLYFLVNAFVRVGTGEDGFGLHTQELAITWQRMYYFSFTTLTTLGYGDITPVSPFAEPFVTAEAIIGVMYVAVLMARLVSLYDKEEGGL